MKSEWRRISRGRSRADTAKYLEVPTESHFWTRSFSSQNHQPYQPKK